VELFVETFSTSHPFGVYRLVSTNFRYVFEVAQY